MKRNKKQLDESMWKGADSSTFQKAQLLRKEMTNAEQILWSELKENKLLGYKFRRQHPIGFYIVDFYCHKLKLIIEVDGNYHNLKEQILYDKERTRFLNFNGLRIIRFKNIDVEHNIGKVLNDIKREIELIID